MKIEIKQKYKSLNPFISEELNGLTVITGKNGSGKSQLLELIGNINEYRKNGNGRQNIELEPALKNIQVEGITKLDTNSITLEWWKELIKKRIEVFNNIPRDYLTIRKYIKENNLLGRNINDDTLLSNDVEYVNLIKFSTLSEFERNQRYLNEKEKERLLLGLLFGDEYKSFFNLLDEVCIQSGKNEKDIVVADFYNYPISEHLIDENSLFGSQIEVIFYNYAKRRDENSYRQFRKEKYNESNNSVSDEEFVQKHPVPWEMINEILETHKIEFKFKEIKPGEFSKDVPFNIEIFKNGIADAIKFSELSSGEKVIFGLILKLFTSRYYKEALKFPDLIVLDEPDAHLHPEMSRLLLDILEQTFVQKLGIKVIITTHSPSTVALAPEESLYELKNGIESSLKKISKDNALQLLTSFIPTLSIDYKNHRQIFCESPNDIYYYQQLYNRHIQEKSLLYKLYFMSNALGEGNCDQVVEIVKTLRNSGIKTSYGIVDWDLKNSERGANVFVHGKGERYSVENFVFDPIYIICSLIDIRNMEILSEIGYDRSLNQYLLGDKEDSEIQRIVDIFFGLIKKNEKYEGYNYTDTGEIEYLNGKKIKIPNWYLIHEGIKGHGIVDIIFDVFPPLKNRYQNKQSHIQEALTIIMTKCYPFVPLTSIKLLEEIGN